MNNLEIIKDMTWPEAFAVFAIAAATAYVLGKFIEAVKDL